MTNKFWTQVLALALLVSFTQASTAKALTPEQLCAGLTNVDVCIAALKAQANQAATETEAQKEAKAKAKAAKEKAAAEKAQKEAEELAKQQEESDNFVEAGVEKTTLGYNTVVNIGSHKGQTFFVTMQKEIKPKLDRYATHGFQVVSGNTALERLKKVDKKVYNKAIRAAGSEANVKKIADELTKDSSVTFYDLPQAIMQVGIGGGAYDLSTIYALLSGGGVAVRIEDGSYAYNVNYGTGDVAKDEMTGRSFGEAPGRLALDASDAHYLTILEKYVRNAGEGSRHFYHALLKILMNSDPADFGQISNEGKAVASDFVAVYIAEQDRHLMADLQSHHWDVALLEVTLLSALHAGQSEVAVMYRDKLTSRTLKQQNGCATTQAPEQKASMVDYWQFSTNTDPSGCNRSGINPTKREFRKLGRLITQFERQKHPQLVKKIENNMGSIQKSGNVFADLSTYLISFQAPRNMSAKQMELAEDFAEFLMQVRADADEISASIKAAQ
jgi:hypothetical protein